MSRGGIVSEEPHWLHWSVIVGKQLSFLGQVFILCKYARPARSFERSQHIGPGDETRLGCLVFFLGYDPARQRLVQSLQCFGLRFQTGFLSLIFVFAENAGLISLIEVGELF